MASARILMILRMLTCACALPCQSLNCWPFQSAKTLLPLRLLQGGVTVPLRGVSGTVSVQCQPNQRAGTDGHTEPGYLLKGSRPGHTVPDVGTAVLLLSLIKVAPECAVRALD